MIAVVVVTHRRVHLLRQCVENALARTSDLVSEVVIWDNASADGTREYLQSLDDPRVKVVLHEENIGQSAYRPAFAMTSAPYLIELDDDIIDAPPDWDRALLEAYRRLPTVGFLAANLVDNPHDTLSHTMYHERPHEYREETVNGVSLVRGPVGGACALTSRKLLERVGGFRTSDSAFFLEDEAYINDIAAHGYEAAYLRDVKVTHAGGAYYSEQSAAKHEYWRSYWKREIRKNRIKKALLAIPGVRSLNARRGWFRLADVPDFEPGDLR
jgi:GT2 family glycosyltransferase